MRLGTHILKEEEIDRLYRSIRNQLKQFSEKLRTGHIDPEDVAQEVMLSLYRWGSKFKGTITKWENVESYLYGIIRNRVRFEVRKKMNRLDHWPLLPEDAERERPAHHRKSLDGLIPSDTLKKMADIWRRLSKEDRQIIAQLIRGKNNTEVAIWMGKGNKNPGAIKMAGGRMIKRTLEKFALRLEEQGHTEEAELIRRYVHHRTMHGPNPQEIFLYLREAQKRRRRARPLHRRV